MSCRLVCVAVGNITFFIRSMHLHCRAVIMLFRASNLKKQYCKLLWRRCGGSSGFGDGGLRCVAYAVRRVRRAGGARRAGGRVARARSAPRAGPEWCSLGGAPRRDMPSWCLFIPRARWRVRAGGPPLRGTTVPRDAAERASRRRARR